VEYIVITLLTLSVTTFIVYMLAKKVFGIFLKLKSLLLCAACALLISLVLPRIIVSFAGLAGTVIFLAIFAIVFAYLVAYLDNPNDFFSETVAATTSTQQIAQNPVESRNTIINYEQANDILTSKKETNIDTMPDKVMALISSMTDISDLLASANVPKPASDSLDDLIDFAFQQKEYANNQVALATFRRAFNLYQDSDAAPLLAIEITNLLINQGAYDEAISILTLGRNLPGLKRNSTLDQEFVTTIAYFRIIKNTLIQRRTGYLPFNQIPVEINAEINAEFREWRALE